MVNLFLAKVRQSSKPAAEWPIPPAKTKESLQESQTHIQVEHITATKVTYRLRIRISTIDFLLGQKNSWGPVGINWYWYQLIPVKWTGFNMEIGIVEWINWNHLVLVPVGIPVVNWYQLGPVETTSWELVPFDSS